MRQTVGTGAAQPPPLGTGSSLYTGTLSHHRYGPGPAHSFRYRVAMPLVFLDEIDAVVRSHPMWSARLPAPVWARRSDLIGRPGRPPEDEVRDLVQKATGERPLGRVAFLGNLRTWGWLFNPISLYFCYSPDGGTVETLLAEVENTPWHQRHSYVVGGPGVHRFSKQMHVSPFMPMGCDYVLSYEAPGERLRLRFDLVQGDRPLLTAALSLSGRPLDRAAMWAYLLRYPAMAHRVSAGIYSQAARLALAGAPFFAHPHRAGAARPGSQRRPACETRAPGEVVVRACPNAPVGALAGNDRQQQTEHQPT